MGEVAFIEVEWFDSMQIAVAAEAVAIERERPLWNKRGTATIRRLTETSRTALAEKLRGIDPDIKLGPQCKYPIMTLDQIKAVASLWYSDATRALLVEQVGVMLECEIPMSWVRDQMIKHYGHARRTPEPGWDKIEIVTKKERADGLE